MRKQSEGICRSCLKTFSGATIGRHLLSCKAKQNKDSEETGAGKKPQTIYHIKLKGGGPFWLHIEMKSTSTLLDLDGFLRDIWVECCGHLSEFTISGKRYMTQDMDLEEQAWIGPSAGSARVSLEKVLKVKEKFGYEYDFGSTTYVEGELVAERQGTVKEKVRILARNNLPLFECSECDNPATFLCSECYEPVCEECAKEHACGDEMLMPVVNSPRMGVCGYTGGSDPDRFQVDAHR